MKVLIVGSNEFLITHIVDKYIKEDYKIQRICEEVQEEKNKRKEVKIYNKSLLSDDIKNIFKSNKFEEVLYIPSEDESNESFKLKNLLELSIRYKAKKVTYVSSQEVYGDLSLEIDEDSELKPKSLIGIKKKDCEDLIDKYRGKIDTLIIRQGRIYGPLYEGNIDKEEKNKYIYISDFIEGLYRLSSGKYVGIFNISKDVKSSKIKRTIDWDCIISEKQGEKLIEDYNLDYSRNIKRSSKKKIVFETVFSYIMTAIIFILFLIVDKYLGSSLSIGTVNIVLIYIVVVSVVYGMNQGIVANVLSIAYLLNSYINQNRDALTLLLDYRFISEILICMSIALLVGYYSDKRELKIKAAEEEFDYLKEKYKFIEELSEEVFIEKIDLERQILNSENSIGNLYRIISSLDSLETQDILNNAVSVLEEILDNNTISIYSANKSGEYMRLEVSSNNSMHKPEKSIKFNKNSKVYEKLISDKFYVNKDFNKELPEMIGAISDDENIQAIITIDTLGFENMNLYYENMFKVTIKLITAAINKAMTYQNAINSEKYANNTKILKEDNFKKVLDIKIKAQEEKHSSLSIIAVEECTLSEEVLSQVLEDTLRETDYFGYMNGKVNILLSNINEDGIEIVKERLNNKGIKVQELSEGSLLCIN